MWHVKMKHLGGELKLYKKHGSKYIFLSQALVLFNNVWSVIGDPNASKHQLLRLINTLFDNEQTYMWHIKENANKYKEITETMWSQVVDIVNL
jgi:hypothetical protein